MIVNAVAALITYMYCFPGVDRTLLSTSRSLGDRMLILGPNRITAGIPPVKSRRDSLSISSAEYNPVIAVFVVNASPAPIAFFIYPGRFSAFSWVSVSVFTVFRNPA